MANLEGGCGAVAFASGIAAQAAALFTLLSPGDHVVSSSALYGGTVNQFKHMLRKMSVELTWVDPDDLQAWTAAVGRTPRRSTARRLAIRVATCSISRRSRRSRTSTRCRCSSTTPSPRRISAARSSGSRHCRALGDQVHRRPRHEHRRCRDRLGAVQLVERQIPGHRRPLARVSRPAVPRDVRHLRVHEASGGDVARPRRRR